MKFRCIETLLGVAGLCATVGVAWGAEFRPVDLQSGANSYFADKIPDDKQGGWTDQGGNDLRLLPAGNLSAAGVAFDIRSDADGKSCIVVAGNLPERDYLPQEATLSTTPQNAANLYLFHAAAWAPARDAITGRLTVSYENGTAKEWRVRNGRDVSDWWQQNLDFSNAAIAWDGYNRNSTVYLYVSKFDLDPEQKVKSVHFKAENGAWMIAGVTLGDNVTLEPSQKRAPGSCAAPKLPTDDFVIPELLDGKKVAEVQKTIAADAAPRNIIFIIGDGMGQGACTYTSWYARNRAEGLNMHQMPYRGLAQTYSANAPVTDSAASGTALSSGYKTNNGFVGVTPEGTPMISIAQAAHNAGKSVGIITTDQIVGATPMAFMAHIPDRGRADDLALATLNTDYEVIIGNKNKMFADSRDDKRSVVGELEAKGYVSINALDSFKNAPEQAKIVGAYEVSDPELGDVAAEAIRRLSQDPDGFFLMVESAHPDYGGHGNNPILTLAGTLAADATIKAALEFAMSSPDTLIVVTADHETGGLYCAPNPVDNKRPSILYATQGHSGAPVNVFAFGAGAQFYNRILENYEIPRIMAHFWDLQLNVPVEMPAK